MSDDELEEQLDKGNLSIFTQGVGIVSSLFFPRIVSRNVNGLIFGAFNDT